MVSTRGWPRWLNRPERPANSYLLVKLGVQVRVALEQLVGRNLLATMATVNVNGKHSRTMPGEATMPTRQHRMAQPSTVCQSHLRQSSSFLHLLLVGFRLSLASCGSCVVVAATRCGASASATTTTTTCSGSSDCGSRARLGRDITDAEP